MLTLSHTTVFVLDQDSAKEFYTSVLGFELRDDFSMGAEFEGGGAGFRWLTVGPQGDPTRTIILADFNPDSFRPRSEARVFKTTVRALPAMSNGGLFIRDEHTLKRFDLANP